MPRRAGVCAILSALGGAAALALLLAAAAPISWAASNGAPDEPQVTGQGAYADLTADAGQFIEGLGQRAVGELTGGAIDEGERELRFRTLLADSFDLKAIGHFVLGQQWRRASEAQQDAFLAVFEDAIVQRFLPLFRSYSGQSFSIGRARRDETHPSHVFVETTVEQLNGEPVSVEWLLRERVGNDSYRIIDVYAEGVSLAITLRQEYASVVRRSGLDYLIAELRRKVEAGDFAPRGDRVQ